MSRTSLFPSLPRGTYTVRCREATLLKARLNGHGAVWPHARAESDGESVVFFHDGKRVYDCNAAYAAANFDHVKT